MSQASQRSNGDAAEQEEDVMAGPKVVEALQVCGVHQLSTGWAIHDMVIAIWDFSARLRKTQVCWTLYTRSGGVHAEKDFDRYQRHF
jgi:hypothetical protein